MTESALRFKVAGLSGRAALPVLLLPYGLWRVIVRGDVSWDAIILTLGSAVTWPSVMLYRSTLFVPRTERSFALAFRTWAAFLPWAFMCYLFFYEGLWGLISLWWDFSVLSLAGSLFCAWLGLRSVKAMDVLSSKEMAEACAAEAG